MGHIILGIFIGATLLYYITNRIFRHGVNCILLFFFRIPIYIIEYIDRHTCPQTQKPKAIKSRAITYETTKPMITRPPAQQAIKAEPKPVEKKSALPNFEDMDDEELSIWIANNVGKVTAKGRPVT